MTGRPEKQFLAGRAPLSRVRSVSQVQLSFQSEDPHKTFREIRQEALQWLANRAGRPLPKHAWDGESFDMLEVGAQPVSALAIEEPSYWCFHLSDADKTIARRSWTIEAGLLLDHSGVMFGCRLQCVALGASPDFDATIPGVVAQVANHHVAYLDGRRASTKAWSVDSDGAVAELVDLLLDSTRSRPVIVISLGDKDGHDGRTVIDADELAQLTVGAAHVATLTSASAYALTDQLGKEFSVFHQAVRTYRPRLDINEDTPNEHPIALPASIAEWPDGGPDAFKRFLVEHALRDTVVGVDIYRDLPSFADIHGQLIRQRRTKAREAGAPDKELLALALEEIDVLRQKLGEETDAYTGLLKTAEGERDLVSAERDRYAADCHALRSRMLHLEAALRDTGKEQEIPTPDTFEGLDDWCRSHLAGKVDVMPRAIRCAMKCSFENSSLAYKTLLILRNLYVPMKCEGGWERKCTYEQALAQLGLEEGPSFGGEARAGEGGDEYKVTYNGRRRYLDRHIKGSNSRDERFGFRLYFFWDEDSRQAVVGSFPTHLSTRAT